MEETIQLFSPPFDVQPGSQCLEFRYKLRLADLVVSVMNSTDKKTVLTIAYDGQEFVWHRAWVDVNNTELGQAKLGFRTLVKPLAGNKVALDDIRLLAGNCKKQGRWLFD